MDRVTAILNRVSEVCPLPKTTERVMELTAGDGSSVKLLGETIASDPALATTVLRVANSAIYGGGAVDQLDRAIMRIGLRGLRELAAAMSLFATFQNKGESSLSLHDRSLVCGTLAHKLAKETNLVPPSTAFVCGLLSEVGAMVCLAATNQEYLTLWQEAAGSLKRRVELEIEHFGAHSFAIGAQFLLRSKIPENVASAIAVSGLEPLDACEPLVRLLLAARMVTPIMLRLGLEPDHTESLAELEEIGRRVGLPGVDGARLYELALNAGEVAAQVLGRTR